MDRLLVFVTASLIASLVYVELTCSRTGAGVRAIPIDVLGEESGARRSKVESSGIVGTAVHVALGYAKDSWHSPRLHLRNDKDAIAWPSEDVEQKETLLRPVIQRCHDPVQRRSFKQRRLRITGIDTMAAGRWNRFWAVAECSRDERGGTVWAPCCSGGDVLDVQMESPTAKVAVDRVYDIGDTGVYEVQLYLRKKHPAYTLGVHLALSGVAVGQRILLANKSLQALPEDMSSVVMKRFPHGGHYATVAVTRGDDVVPVQRPCTAASAFQNDVEGGGAADLRDRFRFGAWYRLDSDACDGVHCDGTTSALDTERWVWASDLCRVQLFTADEVSRRLHNRLTFAWGTSTLRQPLDILYRRLLGGKSHSESDGYPVRWAWAGCTHDRRSVVMCKAEGHGVGFSTWASRAAGIFANGSVPVDHVLIERTAWLTDDTSEAVYFVELREWLARYRAALKMRSQRKPPVQVFHNFVAWGYAKRYSVKVHFHRHWSLLLEDYMVANAPEFAFISRQEMTLPLHFGDVFVHSSLHYGSSAAACSQQVDSICRSLIDVMNISTVEIAKEGANLCTEEWTRRQLSMAKDNVSGFSLSRLLNYQPANCVRKTHGDAAVVASWLNVVLTR